MIKKVLAEAKKKLHKDPFDAGHDYDHHLAVATNCLVIIKNENLQLDIDALLIAAWWHDYKRGQDEENDRIVTEVMQQAGYAKDYINKVLAIKNSHSYGMKQEVLEAQVLFDADKLEYLSAARMKKVSDAVTNGEMLLEVQKRYKIKFAERIGNVLDQIHFNYTKKEAKKRIKTLKKLTQNYPLWKGVVDGL